MTNKKTARQIICQIAAKENISASVIYEEMTKAIDVGFFSNDLTIRDRWRSIPHTGKKPTPEDVIVWAADLLKTSL